MNQDIAKQWVAALRSGAYQQGKQYLEREGRHCCLGVLCDLAVREGVTTRVKMGPDGETVFGFDLVYGGLPEVVMGWAGIRNSLGHFAANEPAPLYHLNDSGVYTFREIADVIERHYESL